MVDLTFIESPPLTGTAAAQAPAPATDPARHQAAPQSSSADDQAAAREVAAACLAQILQDIDNRQSPYRMLLCAAEALDRLSGGKDAYFLQVQQRLRMVYGTDDPTKWG